MPKVEKMKPYEIKNEERIEQKIGNN